ncbi:MAG: TerB family tellurite resistance protein [Sedimentisphaerales bacterium]|nr:TerB family tellurite resistance protein [Sedimentisphaerales bacterium]
MGVILFILFIIAAIAVFFSLDLKGQGRKAVILSIISNIKFRILDLLPKKFGISHSESNEVDLNVLNCRVQPAIHKDGKDVYDAFAVEICGSIHTPCERLHSSLRINILDITDGMQKEKPVQAKAKSAWTEQGGDSQNFCFTSDLGTLPNKVTVLSQWTNVARLRIDQILMPRKGKRVLQFTIAILSAENRQELACAQCIYEHENLYFGYLDLQENIERSKTLAVALAFSINAADGRLDDCEIEFIKNWARENINKSHTSDTARKNLEKALDETVAFFKDGNILNTYDICMEIAEIVPLAQRYDILDFCLNAVKTGGSVGTQELHLLRDIVSLLEIDGEKFRTMMEKIIPFDMLDTTDFETILGVTSDMTGERARAHLNREYAKWNSRVTNSDPKIQSQADQMMKLIAEARSQFTKK